MKKLKLLRIMENKKENQLKILTKYFIDKFSPELLLDERVPENNEEKQITVYCIVTTPFSK